MDPTPETVRGLLDAQFPAWRGLAVRRVDSHGTDNAIYRVGPELVARFPLHDDEPAAVRQRLQAEALAAATLLGRTRFRTPEPVALGEPGPSYPLHWAVQTWVPGTPCTVGTPELAVDLAEFIHGVRAIPTGGHTFRGSGRGGVLHAHDEWLELCFDRSHGLLDVPRLRGLWRELRELPRGPEPDVTSHSDLIPGNVLVTAGRLGGIIDVGGLQPADPALDLVCAWHLFDTAARDVLRAALGSGDTQWERGRAWAFQQAMGLVWYYVDSNPAMAALGRRTLQRIVAG